jgi:outer membrane protein assembly factor BamE (lipoprotein component of BamABCDE complex)
MMVVVAVLALAFWLVSGVSETLLLTSYSTGFREERFATIRVGMTANQVETILGPPIAKEPWGEGTENWQYSGPRGPAFYRRRWVLFNNGRVLGVVSDIMDR